MADGVVGRAGGRDVSGSGGCGGGSERSRPRQSDSSETDISDIWLKRSWSSPPWDRSGSGGGGGGGEGGGGGGDDRVRNEEEGKSVRKERGAGNANDTNVENMERKNSGKTKDVQKNVEVQIV